MAEEHVCLDAVEFEVRTEDDLEVISELADVQNLPNLDVGIDHEEVVGRSDMVQAADEIYDRVLEAVIAQNDSTSDSYANHRSFWNENCSCCEESDSESDREKEESSSSSSSSSSTSGSDSEDSCKPNTSLESSYSAEDDSDTSYDDSSDCSSDQSEEQATGQARREAGSRFVQNVFYEPVHDADTDNLGVGDVLIYLENNGRTLVIAFGTENYTEFLKMSVHLARDIVADFAAERRRAQWEWQRLQEMLGENVEDEDNSGGAMRGAEEPAEEGRREGRRRRRQWVRVKRVDCRGKMYFPRRKRNGTRSRRIDSRSRKKKWTGIVN
ncbi:hypothetical protein PoB_000526400 [Plakobranchus ocellatus]|uniref:Uncharacterized protein n=1 Tax=Plakobranchus ocellatus TaxID=259542 RepID=A0AAV3Y9K6_9GAST|nr:hypothetical protein PoB_000526400 [Plakobranchus ocellatus]